jgi:hypothetical protein
MQKDPLFSWASLPTVDEKTQADFSPNDKRVLVLFRANRTESCLHLAL